MYRIEGGRTHTYNSPKEREEKDTMAMDIIELIKHPDRLADRAVVDELRLMVQKFPYFQAARLLYLKGLYLLRDASFGAELRRTAPYVSDRKVLFNLIEGEYYKLAPVPRKKQVEADGKEGVVDRTQVLIDAFLSGLPPEPEESGFAPTEDDGGLSADYATYILTEESLDDADENQEGNVVAMKGQHLIDGFIKNNDKKISLGTTSEFVPVIDDEVEKLPGLDEEDGYFTETLAKIYIKQHRYAKALEIIRRLSLKYPKKNAYFADQINYLEKLITNSIDK